MKKLKLRKVCSIFAGGIGVTLLLGMSVPAYANDDLSKGSIYEMFQDKTYENYDKYALDLNITKESNGVKMTINKVVYDELNLAIFYTVESENKLPEFTRFPRAELKIDGKRIGFSAGGDGKFLNDGKTFIGSIEYHVADKKVISKEAREKNDGYIELSDKFIFTLNIDEIGTPDDSNSIKGTWNFNIPVSSERVKGKVNEKDCDINLSNIVNGYHINKIITTPINTQIQGTQKDEDSDLLLFNVFDDKGRYIKQKAGMVDGCQDKEGKYIISYFSNTFKDIYDDTESLTFIPYKQNYNSGEDAKKEIAAKLNLQGQTKLYSADGQDYANITKVQTENGKTKIYYKSKYGILAAPIEITNNKTNEKIVSMDNSDDMDSGKQAEDTIYISSSDEYVITCDKVITEGDYTIKVIDKSKSIEVYNDNKFTMRIKQ